MWRRYTIPAPGEPGSETWPKNSEAWTQGGGPTWRSGSYDPQLDLVYWGTGNAEPYDPRPREGLDSLYTNERIGQIRPKTGELVCYYQYTPNDVYDVDATDEQILTDLTIGGQLRKVMIQTNKNGFLYVVDRTNCKLIAAHAFVKVNWATHIDLVTGRPVLTDIQERFRNGEKVEIWPSRGTNAVPAAFDPNTHLVYASTWNVPQPARAARAAEAYRHWWNDHRRYRYVSGTSAGRCIGPLRGDQSGDWRKEMGDPADRYAGRGGHIGATGGGLLFTGKLTGEFVALDEDTGKTLWQFQTGSSINSAAITYTHKGRRSIVTIAFGTRRHSGHALRVAQKMPTGRLGLDFRGNAVARSGERPVSTVY